jgi:thioesterase domain-containing protein
MRRVQPAGPYWVGGYSFGGLVAFEIAQQLRRAGESIGLLALIECDGAHAYRTRVGQLGVFVRNLLAMDVARATHVVLDRAAFALSVARRRLAQSRDARVVTREIDRQKDADIAAGHAYRPSSYDGDLTLFACEERPMTAVVDERCGWGEVVQGEIAICRVPGDHYTMLAKPNVEVLARALQQALDAGEQRHIARGGCRPEEAPLDPRA